MRVYSSLWNADSWATRGGLVKIDWTKAPFIARLRHFRARACKYEGPISVSKCAAPTPGNWWNSPVYAHLSFDKHNQMNWVRDNFMIYDYCKDFKRFNGLMPGECFKPQYWWPYQTSFLVLFFLLHLIYSFRKRQRFSSRETVLQLWGTPTQSLPLLIIKKTNKREPKTLIIRHEI